MTILWGFKQDKDRYTGGRILDPHSGSIYRGYLQPVDGFKKLKVRGYIGFSLLGRTEVWDRLPSKILKIYMSH